MILGLTGGIGSGKSTVARVFSVLGIPVYNSDERARQMYYLPEVKQKIVALLGESAYLNDGKINKSYISSKIFADRELLQKVNNIIHPAVGKDFKEFIKQHSEQKIILKESALLFEAGLKDKVDKILLVTAPEDVRIRRVMSRDNILRDEIRKRINSQLPDSAKLPYADFVVINDETQAIIPQVLKIYRELLGD